MDIVVFGAGSLGSLIGGLLAERHDVTLVGRAPHVEVVQRDGLRITGRLRRTVHPRAVTAVDSPTADLGVVTVKAYDTSAAGEALAAGDIDAALSLQNGMGNEETLAAALACPVLAGTTSYGADLRAPGVVECTGIGEVVVGPRPGDPDRLPIAERVGQAFRAADVVTSIEADMEPHLWEKLAINAGINPVTALARVENGALDSGPAGDVAERAAAEAARVAREQDVALSDTAARDALNRVIEMTAANRSSMYQDVAAGRRTEIEAISGYVVDLATTPVPVTETVASLIRAWEAGRELR